MTETQPDSDRSRTWIGVTILIVFLLLFSLYFGAPILLVAPFIKANDGQVPTTIEKLFAPLEWLYDHSDIYEGYINWQRRAILDM